MIRKYHNHTLQINPWHRKEEPQNINSNNTRQLKQSNYLSLPRQDDCTEIMNDIMKTVCSHLRECLKRVVPTSWLESTISKKQTYCVTLPLLLTYNENKK